VHKDLKTRKGKKGTRPLSTIRKETRRARVFPLNVTRKEGERSGTGYSTQRRGEGHTVLEFGTSRPKSGLLNGLETRRMVELETKLARGKGEERPVVDWSKQGGEGQRG